MPKSLNSIDSFSYSLNRLYLDTQLYQLIPVISNTPTSSTTTTSNNNLPSHPSNEKDANKGVMEVDAPTYRITTPSQLIERYSNVQPKKVKPANPLDAEKHAINLEKEPLERPTQDDTEKSDVISSTQHRKNNSNTDLDEVHLDAEGGRGGGDEEEEEHVDLRKLNNANKSSSKFKDDIADEYLKLRLNHYKNNLSKIIKNRYATEPYLLQQQKNTTKPTSASLTLSQSQQATLTRINKNIGPFYEQKPSTPTQHPNNNISTSASASRPAESTSTNFIVYNKNIDNLTSELLTALSNGLNKDLLSSHATSSQKLSNILSSQTGADEHQEPQQKQSTQSKLYEHASSIREADVEDELESQSEVKTVNVEAFYPENYSGTENFSEKDEDFQDDDDYMYEYDDENQPSDYEDERIIFGNFLLR